MVVSRGRGTRISLSEPGSSSRSWTLSCILVRAAAQLDRALKLTRTGRAAQFVTVYKLWGNSRRMESV